MLCPTDQSDFQLPLFFEIFRIIDVHIVMYVNTQHSCILYACQFLNQYKIYNAMI